MHNPQQIIRHLYAANVISYISVIMLLLKIKQQNNQYKRLFDITKYMGSLLDQSDVNLDEFDMIALREMGVILEEVDEEIEEN